MATDSIDLTSGMIPYSSLPEYLRPIARQQSIEQGSDMRDVASVDPARSGTITVDRPDQFTPPVAAHELTHATQNKVGGGKYVNTHTMADPVSAYGYTTKTVQAGIGNMNMEQQASIPHDYMKAYPKAVKTGGAAVDALNAKYSRSVQQLQAMAAQGMPVTPQPPGAPPAALTGIAVPLPGMMSSGTMSAPTAPTLMDHLRSFLPRPPSP